MLVPNTPTAPLLTGHIHAISEPRADSEADMVSWGPFATSIRFAAGAGAGAEEGVRRAGPEFGGFSGGQAAGQGQPAV
eukprot:8824000-Alexandrium_andersonii.AAC.1